MNLAEESDPYEPWLSGSTTFLEKMTSLSDLSHKRKLVQHSISPAVIVPVGQMVITFCKNKIAPATFPD